METTNFNSEFWQSRKLYPMTPTGILEVKIRSG